MFCYIKVLVLLCKWYDHNKSNQIMRQGVGITHLIILCCDYKHDALFMSVILSSNECAQSWLRIMCVCLCRNVRCPNCEKSNKFIFTL